MTKSELIDTLASKLPHLSYRDVELSVKTVLDGLINALHEKRRVEIRGFGSFSLHHRAARKGRNPKTGVNVQLDEKFVPHFKPGKALRDRVNNPDTPLHDDYAA
ncbi:MAG: integration host factor subunit beta [marine bacterium B5-7]|nr:MAG: integration host factor subunit beta [marine bacterium B5-7]